MVIFVILCNDGILMLYYPFNVTPQPIIYIHII
jgi:hypothetical protein